MLIQKQKKGSRLRRREVAQPARAAAVPGQACLQHRLVGQEVLEPVPTIHEEVFPLPAALLQARTLDEQPAFTQLSKEELLQLANNPRFCKAWQQSGIRAAPENASVLP